MRTPFYLIPLLISCISIPPAPELRGPPSPSSNSTAEPGELQIHIPHVGQGDATLLVSPNGNTLLIDTGPPEAPKTTLLPLLRRLGISHLQALIVTHYDLDHFGGLPALLAGEDAEFGTKDDIIIDEAYDRGSTPWDYSPGWIPYLNALQQAGISRMTLQPGQTLELDPEVELRCVAANGTVLDSNGSLIPLDLTPETYVGQENASSIALLLRYKNFSYLTAGDLTGGGNTNGYLTPDVESLLGDAVRKVDALHVNHHGSLSSSNPHFVEETRPEAVFIQVGTDNVYGHPAFEVVNRWKKIGAEVYSTHEGNGFLITTDGSENKVTRHFNAD